MDAIANLAVNTIRTLSLDAVQKANSGHPGLPMGSAPMAYVLFQTYLKRNPKDPRWPDRGGFVACGGQRSPRGWQVHLLSAPEVPLAGPQLAGQTRFLRSSDGLGRPKVGRVTRRHGQRPRRRVYIGSSSEALSAAMAVQTNLDPALETTVWTQGVFRPGEYRIQSLSRELKNQDFAVFVATADDVTLSRGQASPTMRDNLHVEIGMAVVAVGLPRVFVLCDRSRIASLPSDLEGINTIAFSPPSNGNWVAALGAACSAVEDAIRGAVSARRGRRHTPKAGINPR